MSASSVELTVTELTDGGVLSVKLLVVASPLRSALNTIVTSVVVAERPGRFAHPVQPPIEPVTVRVSVLALKFSNRSRGV